jgi:hypothetical protein
MFPFFLFSPHTLWLILLTFIFLSFFYIHRSILGIHDEELFLAPKTSIASSPLAKEVHCRRLADPLHPISSSDRSTIEYSSKLLKKNYQSSGNFP